MMISAMGLQNTSLAQRVIVDNIANVTHSNYQEKSVKITDAGVVVTLSSDAIVKNNVNLEKNIVDMMVNKHVFSANLAVIKTQNDMQKSLLDIVV